MTVSQADSFRDFKIPLPIINSRFDFEYRQVNQVLAILYFYTLLDMPDVKRRIAGVYRSGELRFS